MRNAVCFWDRQSTISAAPAPRLSALLVLLVAVLMTTSCGTIAQAAASQSNPISSGDPRSLNLSGSLPRATVNESYNAVLAVGGGNSPYFFMVTSGSLPPGMGLNQLTGTISGKPSAAGSYAFQVRVTDWPRHDEGAQQFAISVLSTGGGGGGGTVKVTVSPASATLVSKQTQQFTATVSGTSDSAVTWSATTGSLSTNGLYVAPTVTAQTSALITATSVADPTKSASAAITINPVNVQALKITTSGLPQGQQGDSYNEAFTATGGTSPYTWTVSGGTLPSGISMSSSGDLAGIPNSVGTFNFTVKVTDAAGATATGNFSVGVIGGSNFDGPAELPRVTVPTAMTDSPTPGSVINVNSGGDLQSALNNAHCGDVIQLQAGATFSGKFQVPAKNCDDSHWIVIRTSSSDSALPAEGQRATPCYAGVASLQGRPQYSCSSPKNVMARVQLTTQGDGPFQIAAGANYYRFVGLEVTRPAGSAGPGRLITTLGTADHIIVDRSWLHGGPQDETHLGVSLNGMTNAAVIDSYFSDFHCISASGTCTDSHAISGGCSNTQDGPYKIQDNFIEATSEGILFGGGAATLSPSDIQILNNHFWKPWQWMPGNTPFVGGANGNPFVVKNHLELKNAVRVLVEANLMENNWAGFSQNGSAMLLTPKNQHEPNGSDVCPLCQVTDVTVRYVHIAHAGAGIQMATAISGDGKDGAPALSGTRWSIHDVVLEDLSTKYKGGGSVFLIMNMWPKNPLNTITINHVTGFPDPTGHMMVIGNIYSTVPMYGLVFTNNMVVTSAHPVWNTGGGQDNCAYHDVPVTSITACFTTFTFNNNGLVETPPAFPPSTWPSPNGNMFPQTISDAGFINYNNGNGGNYELQANSPYKNKGSDGKDLGADVVGLNAALANVE